MKYFFLTLLLFSVLDGMCQLNAVDSFQKNNERFIRNRSTAGLLTNKTVGDRFNELANLVGNSRTASVKDYGAKGDGIVDDAPALQVAINASIAARSELYFPAGTYRLATFPHIKTVTYSGTQTVLFALKATGPVRLRFEKGARLVFINTPSYSNHENGILFQDSTVILGGEFKMAATVNYSGRILHFEGTRSKKVAVVLRDASFEGGYMQCAFHDYCDGVEVAGCTFDNSRSNIGGHGLFADDCRWFKNVSVHHNRFLGSPNNGDAIELNNDNLTINSQPGTGKVSRLADEWNENIYVDNNYIRGYYSSNGTSGLGIGLAGKFTNLSITNNQVDSCIEGVHIEHMRYSASECPSNVTISGNRIVVRGADAAIISNHISTAGIAIYSVGSALPEADRLPNMNITITGNNVAMDSSATGSGILLASVNGVVVSANTIGVRNVRFPQFASRSYTGIAVRHASDIAITGNVVVNQARAIGFVGGEGRGLAVTKSVTGNIIQDCDIAYFLDEWPYSVGDVILTGNSISGCRRLFENTKAGTKLMGTNERVYNNTYEKIVYQNSLAATLSRATRGDVLNFSSQASLDTAFQGANFRGDSWYPGQTIKNLNGGTKRILAAGALSDLCVAPSGLNVIGAAGQDYVTYSNASITDVWSEGKVVVISDVAFSAPVLVRRIDVATKRIYLTAALPTNSTGICYFSKATFANDDPQVPEYANDAAADGDTNLPSGALYKVSSDRTIRKKP